MLDGTDRPPAETAGSAGPQGPRGLSIGCAGWQVPAAYTAQFPTEGSHLERYSRVFPAAEINSSFYRPHRPTTYARWAQTVPGDFGFAVKIPRTITHSRRLQGIETELSAFLAECSALGAHLGPLLVQLPPRLAFEAAPVGAFLETLRRHFTGAVVCEPRHPTWFAAEAERLLTGFQVARVAADPAIVPAAAEPGGWPNLVYYRLHGSPRIYYSAYPPEYLQALIARLADAATRAAVWCIFDNTAAGAATGDALQVLAGLGGALVMAGGDPEETAG